MNTIVLFTRVPGAAPAKTRLLTDLGRLGDSHLARALLLDTLDVVLAVRARVVIAFEPPDAGEALDALVPGCERVAQRGADLGARMAAAIADQLSAGASCVALAGSDVPALRPVNLERVFAVLKEHPEAVVIAPTQDGGYACIGMTKPHEELFEGISWGSPEVYEQTCARARALGIPLVPMPVTGDVDTMADLQRLLASDPLEIPAPRTRAWARAWGTP